MFLRIVIVAVAVVATSSCSRKQSIETTEFMADRYLENQRDGIIASRQARVVDSRACDPFREQFAAEGRKYPTALSGSFHLGLARVRDAAIAAGCWRGQSSLSSQASRKNLQVQHARAQEASETSAYRWKNAEGQWVLADKPPPPGTDFEVIPIRRAK